MLDLPLFYREKPAVVKTLKRLIVTGLATTLFVRRAGRVILTQIILFRRPQY